MAKKNLHPTVMQFKEFVKANPSLIKEVRSGSSTWQELFEEWYLLGENDPRWNGYKEGRKAEEKQENKSSSGDWVSSIITTVKKMDPNQLQGHLQHINQAIGAIQGVISQFQGGTQPHNPSNPPSHPPHPFQFRKD